MHTQAARHCCIRDMSVFSHSSSGFAIDCEARLALSRCAALLDGIQRSKSSWTKRGIPALYRPSTTDTCFVMSSALSPLVQTHAGLSLPGVFAHCTASRAFRLCTNRKLQSTCLGLPRPWRCVTPKAGLASLYTTVLHECTRSWITDWNTIASALAFTRTARTQPNLAQ